MINGKCSEYLLPMSSTIWFKVIIVIKRWILTTLFGQQNIKHLPNTFIITIWEPRWRCLLDKCQPLYVGSSVISVWLHSTTRIDYRCCRKEVLMVCTWTICHFIKNNSLSRLVLICPVHNATSYWSIQNKRNRIENVLVIDIDIGFQSENLNGFSVKM